MKFDVSQRESSYAILFRIVYELNVIAIDFAQKVCTFKNYHFIKFFIKPGATVRMFLCFKKTGVYWNYFSFFI